MTTIARRKEIVQHSDVEASRNLRERKKQGEQKNIVIPDDELNYIETTVDNVIQEKRLQGIHKALVEDVPAASDEFEADFQSIFEGGEEEDENS
jgi:hypothetical protein